MVDITNWAVLKLQVLARNTYKWYPVIFSENDQNVFHLILLAIDLSLIYVVVVDSMWIYPLVGWFPTK